MGIKVIALNAGDGTNSGIDVSYDRKIFGDATVYKEFDCGSTKKIKEDNYKNSYTTLDKYKCIILKYNKSLDSTIYKYDNTYTLVTKKNTLDVTLKQTIEKEITYEESLEISLKNQLNTSIASLVPIDVLNVELNVEEDVSYEVKNAFKKRTSYLTSSTKEVTYHINERCKDVFYDHQMRGLFNVYYVALYNINYVTIKNVNKTWYGKKYNTYIYAVNGYSVADNMYYYEYIPNTAYSGLIPFEKRNTRYYFDAEKDINTVYLD